jgi:hypothetical protein
MRRQLVLGAAAVVTLNALFWISLLSRDAPQHPSPIGHQSFVQTPAHGYLPPRAAQASRLALWPCAHHPAAVPAPIYIVCFHIVAGFASARAGG